ncbi:Protein JASON like [Actinidia chinensis var. chinensis]|uniref:Protein JASON like n=1 Tax=Actinidia chinensis var. chinensis TaxID=1590841 RepID=A0A2R6PEA6_ACTCC|nr:Protein JASON like [Actinidia chinensis var. chinensis]
MGCFLACFGSKDQKNRNRRKNKAQLQRHGIQRPLQSTVSPEQYIPAKLFSESREKLEEQLSPSTRKKVTFDANVKTHEHVSVCESTELIPKSDIEKQKGDNSEKSSLSHSISEDDSISSSVGSYPPNHRYQNCRDSDDEEEEFECTYSDLDEEDNDEEEELEDGDITGEEIWFESKTEISSAQAVSEGLDSPRKSGFPEQEVNKIGNKQNARDRSVYVHPVLNPVENLTQWKAVKSKGTPPLKQPQKENFKSKSDQPMYQNREIAVDASLSNWLVSSETTPTKKTSPIGPEAITSERSVSRGSNSVMSIEDRPILGALTVEELKRFSASSSPRRSPSRSPDEIPIIGTVGTYWRHTESVKDSALASSFKGIPNTTSKYREDKRVNWHSTPFETRLERALNRPAAEA